jgi:uncharacterized protein (TIGR03435 family)
MRLTTAYIAAGLLSAALAMSQSPDTFDVASIKLSVGAPGEGRRSSITHTPTSLTMRNVHLSDCIMWAYGVELYQISGGDQLGTKEYDILAKTASPAPVSQLRRMLQHLLADRFKLALHPETKPLPVYELTIAKGGPKLPRANTDSEDHHVVERLPHVEDGSFVFPDSTLPEFAAKLSLLRGMDRPVVDKTGIAGFFNITLKTAAAALLQENGPSLFTLVPEQLGLKLVPAKAPIDILVIEHAENPTAN